MRVIKEWIEYLKTPSTQLAKSKGLLQQSVALKFRSERLKHHWAGHLRACAQLVSRLDSKNKSVLILGSGHLLETPETSLLPFAKVGLVDMLHPFDVRKVAARNNWSVIDLDLSGLWRPNDAEQLQKIAQPYDYVVSANLLSQIPWSWTHSQPQMTEDLLLNSISNLLTQHWKLMLSLKKPLLLWTDVEEIHFSKLNEVVAQGDTLPGLSLPKQSNEWIWDFAPAPEIHAELSVKLRMQSFKLNFESKL